MDGRRTLKWFHNPDDLGRAEHALVLLEARSKIEHPKFPAAGFKYRFKNVGIVQVALSPLPATGRPDRKFAARFIQQATEYGLRIESRHTAPDQTSRPVDQR